MNGSVKPGLKPQIDITEATVEEQKIIRKLAKIFNIGFFRKTEFKQVNYLYVFCRPSDDFILKFNIETEILVLFNNLDVFERRTLDFVDKLMTDYYNRLDKFCVIIISNDNEICKKILNINAGERLSRVFVPFNYTEILNDCTNNLFVENRFKQYFYARDLYDYDSPIKSESFFFGRSKIVHEFYEKYSNSENTALFGLRKIGKTSVLYAIRRLFESKNLPVVYIDCQSPSFHKRRWFEALMYIIEQAYDQIPNINKELNRLREYNEKDGAKYFENDLKKIRAFKNSKILIIFDEIENITYNISPSSHWRTSDDYLYFWQTIRSIFQRDREIFAFTIVGVNPYVLEMTSINDQDNPIFKIATPKYLNLFNLDTVKEMVSNIGRYMGISYEEGVYFMLYEDFGGHPFLTRIACSNIHKILPLERPQTVSVFWYRQNRAKFIIPVINYVEQLLSVLKNYYQEEYSMLEILARNELYKFGQLVNSSPRVAEHISGYGLVNTTDEQYYFKLKIVEDYINASNTKIKIGLSTEDKWSEISKRRNPLEKKLRGLASLLLKANYGIGDCKKRILGAIPEERRKTIEHLEIEQILEEKYYFLDLMQLYVKEFNVFENIFDKQAQKFYSTMDHINRTRPDAHAKELNDDEYQMIILEFNWLEKCLKNIGY